MTRIKICGIRNITAAQAAIKYGADYLGFVFADGKRHVEPDHVRTILSELHSTVRSVGVFLNQSPSEVSDICRQAGITHIQLHGDEKPADYSFIGLPIIKAIPVTPEGTILDAALDSARYGLLDTRLPGQTGGTGTPFNWSAAAGKLPGIPCFLAGGLNSNNVLEAIELLAPFAVDVSSGVEKSGVKDPELIRQFIQKIRR